MKKWTHLYVFLILSGISSLLRLWGTFMTRFDEASYRTQMESAGISVDEGTMAFMRETSLFQTNVINKVFALFLVILLIVALVFLIKKQFEKASFMYIGYLFGTLILAVYSYVGSKGLVNLYTDETMRTVANSALLGGFAVSVVLFGIYFGLTVFFHLRKPKVLPTLEQNATDI